MTREKLIYTTFHFMCIGGEGGPCMYACLPCVCLVLLEARRFQIP